MNQNNTKLLLVLSKEEKVELLRRAGMVPLSRYIRSVLFPTREAVPKYFKSPAARESADFDDDKITYERDNDSASR